jgi:hypothetical protein
LNKVNQADGRTIGRVESAARGVGRSQHRRTVLGHVIKSFVRGPVGWDTGPHVFQKIDAAARKPDGETPCGPGREGGDLRQGGGFGAGARPKEGRRACELMA